MRFVHMPMAKLSRFVLMQTEMNANGDICVLERIGEAEVCRRVVHRIAA